VSSGIQVRFGFRAAKAHSERFQPTLNRSGILPPRLSDAKAIPPWLKAL